MKVNETLLRWAGKLNRIVRLRRWTVVAGVVVALAIGTVAGVIVSAKDDSNQAAPLFVASSGEPLLNQVSFASGFSSVARSALPAVVNISSSKVVRNPENDFGPFLDDPFFRRFFGERFNLPRERRERSLGSGVIVSSDGYIITNNHVVEGASEIKISLTDKRELKAKIIGKDQKTDIAVLKIDEQGLPALALGDSSKSQVGEFVLAIGNPFGVGQTVTMGIVSATERGNLGIEEYEDFIQTDAPINPGNSGGALVNARGELIGINTAIISRGSMGNQGVGFAVPINLARQVMDQIIKNGKVVRGHMGVVIQEVTPSLAKAFGLGEARGALVSDVTPGSPAAKAGLSKGEVITEINGERVTDSRSLRLKIAQLGPGTPVKLKLLRDRNEREVAMTLGESPSDLQRLDEGNDSSGALEGVTISDLTPQIIRQMGLTTQIRGVAVTEVKPDSAAANAGLRRGDVIQEVNRKSVKTVAEFEQAVSQAGKESVLLLINRNGNTLYIAIEPK